MLWTVLSIILLGVCAFLVFLVLSQDVRGGGLAGALGGGTMQGAFGGRSSESITKLTAWVALAFLLLLLLMGLPRIRPSSDVGLIEETTSTESGVPASPGN